MNEELMKALTHLSLLQHPSIPDLLRKKGYGYEASVVQRVIAEFYSWVKMASNAEWGANSK